ncbi:hypothetical protein POMI540_1800 [Schizosaccharomyces pombe]
MAPDISKKRLPCKVLVFNLPPTLPEQVFLQSINSFLPHVEWHRFSKGKATVGTRSELLSFAYLKFQSATAVQEFFRVYQGHTFIDKKNNTYRAIVTIAPYQKIPPSKVKADSLEGSLEQDPKFQEFKVQRESYSQTASNDDVIEKLQTSTPLLQYLAEKKNAVVEKGKSKPSKKSVKAKKKLRLAEKPASNNSKAGKSSQESKKSSKAPAESAAAVIKEDKVSDRKKSKKKPKKKPVSNSTASQASENASDKKTKEKKSSGKQKIASKKKDQLTTDNV